MVKFLRRSVEVREAAGMTQRGVCRRLEYPVTFITKVERGFRRIDVVELLSVLKWPGVDRVDFIRGLVVPE